MAADQKQTLKNRAVTLWRWAWGGRPLRAPRMLPGPVATYFAISLLLAQIPGPLWLWSILYIICWFVIIPITVCVSRSFATLNCFAFAIRVRIRRGGKIVIRGRSQSIGGCTVPNFACDLGDRLVYTFQPRRATPRILLKATGEESAATWEEF